MKYIVLLSNGLYDHSFQLFRTREEAEAYAKRQVSYKSAHVNELVKPDEFWNMEKQIDIIEEQVRNEHPSWNNEMIRNKAVRIFYLGE